MSFGPRLPCRLKRFALRTKVIVPSHGFAQSHVVTCDLPLLQLHDIFTALVSKGW